MKKTSIKKRAVIYLVILVLLISSGYFIYKKINYKKPIAAKLVMRSIEKLEE